MLKSKKILFIIPIVVLAVLLFAAYEFIIKPIPTFLLPPDITDEQTDLGHQETDIKFNFMNNPVNLKNKVFISTGRFYLPFDEAVNAMNGKIIEDDENFYVTFNENELSFSKNSTQQKFPKTIIEIDGIKYISMFQLLKDSGFVAVFNTENTAPSINILYDKMEKDEYNINASSNSKSAYLRLEDIMADGVKYNDENLEKLRVIGKYLNNRGQKYYIAWIPIYKSPNENIENDLTKDFNNYNASFLYTLDFLVENGGLMGLHGLSHQYNNEKSADGYEFDENTPFTYKECVERMLRAKEIAKDLGYDVNFFEFPHYAFNRNTIRYAEQYFDVIYQQYPKVSEQDMGHIEKIQNGDRLIYYIPTPADYVYNNYDLKGVTQRIDDSIKDDKEVSLFFHPGLDFDFIQVVTTPKNARSWHYTPYAILPSIVDKILTDGYSFNSFK